MAKVDAVYIIEAPGGRYVLSPYSPDFVRQMALADIILREDRKMFRALA